MTRGGVLVALAAVLAAAPAQADPDSCARSYEQAQEHRLEGRLRAAHERLLECAQIACPTFIRNDCTRWLDEVEAGQPSVVFAVRQDGRDLDAVTVTCNERHVTARLDGRPVVLDPGKQACRFEAATALPGTVELLIIEGQKNRIVEVALQTRPLPPPPPPPPSPSWSERWAPSPRLVLAGVGVLGVAGFVALGASGLQAERKLRDNCAPDCFPEEVTTVRRRYLLADLSLGVGVLSLAAAGFLYWRAHDESPAVNVALRPGGGTVVIGGSF